MNMQAIMKQAQAMQKEMLKVKEEIDKTVFEGTNSFVKVQVDGTKKILKVEIDSNFEITRDDIEMLEDMILLATNDALKKVDELTNQKMSKFGGSIPGLF